MTPRSPLEHAWVRWLLVFAICTMMGLIDAVQAHVFLVINNQPIPVGISILLGVSDWYIWALLTPLIVWSARRFPLDEFSPLRVALHGFASILTSLLVVGAGSVILRVLTPHFAPRPPGSLLEVFRSLLNLKIIFYVLIHWLILGVTHGVIFYR